MQLDSLHDHSLLGRFSTSCGVRGRITEEWLGGFAGFPVTPINPKWHSAPRNQPWLTHQRRTLQYRHFHAMRVSLSEGGYVMMNSSHARYAAAASIHVSAG